MRSQCSQAIIVPPLSGAMLCHHASGSNAHDWGNQFPERLFQPSASRQLLDAPVHSLLRRVLLGQFSPLQPLSTESTVLPFNTAHVSAGGRPGLSERRGSRSSCPKSAQSVLDISPRAYIGCCADSPELEPLCRHTNENSSQKQRQLFIGQVLISSCSAGNRHALSLL